MSFGEHLDELRSSLFKAVLSLAVGFGVGLYFNAAIVNFIQRPLTTALAEHVKRQSLEQFRQELAARAEHGDLFAQKMLADPNLEELVNEEGMLPDQVYVAPREILAELKNRYPDALAGVELPAGPAKDAGNGGAETPESPGVATEGESGAGKQASGAASHPFSMADLIPIHLWRSVLKDDRTKLISTGSQETFMIAIKAAFLGGAILSSPLVFYFLWSFVAAGLYEHEKYYVHFFLPFSVGLFLLGAALAFFLVFTPVLRFFFGYNDEFGVSLELRISEWLSFLLLMILGFGISFQLPLVMLFLERIGILSVNAYLGKWKIAVLSLAILSMVLSPGGDPTSMLLMFFPLVGLYFAGIALCKWLPARRPVGAG